LPHKGQSTRYSSEFTEFQRRRRHRPDVVVPDWLMPGLDSIGVLEHLRTAGDKTLTLMLTRATQDAIMLGQTTFEKALASGDIQMAGDGKRFAELLSLLDTFQADFNIVTL